MTSEKFRKLLHELRWGLTQDEFAAKLGLSQRMISGLLTGSLQPGSKTVQALVKAYPERRIEILDAIYNEEPA